MILEKLAIGIGVLLCHFFNGSNLFELGKNIKPDFMIIFIIFITLRKGAMYGLWVGFIGGLLSDAALGGEAATTGIMSYKIGLHALSYSVTAYLLGKLGKAAYNENLLSILIYVLILTLVMRLFVYILFKLFFHQNLNYSFFFTSFYNSALSPIAFWILSWAYRLNPGEQE